MNFKNLLLMLGMVSVQASAFVTVGPDQDCDYNNIQDAYNDPDNFVRVSNQVAFIDEFTISKPQWITGGYNSCADAEQGILGTNKSKWRRINPGSVVTINSAQAGQSLVVISGFEIFGGNTELVRGGGIDVVGNVSLLLNDTEIYDNQSGTGGGLFILGPNATVTMTDVIIRNNQSSGPGGGLYCSDNSTVSMVGESAIHHNEASNMGGGVFAALGCEITFRSGDTLPALQTQRGIYANTAAQGGGVYLQSAAQMNLLGTTEHPASIIFNSSTINDGDEGGGGFYIIGQNTRLDAENARIDLNLAIEYGAGGVVLDQAVFTMKRTPGECWGDGHCSSLSYNILTGVEGVGGALDVYNAGVAVVSQTLIQNNRANIAAVLDSSRAGYVRLEGNVISGNQSWNDDTNTSLFLLTGGAGNGGNLDFFYNTLAENTANDVFNLSNTAQHQLSVHNAIIQHPLTENNNGNANNISAYDCVFMSESASISGNIGFINNNDPLLTDPANGNFRPQNNSPVIDYCDEQTFAGASYQDIVGQDRGFDDLKKDNFLGNHDAGAYEYNNDVIFINSFD